MSNIEEIVSADSKGLSPSSGIAVLHLFCKLKQSVEIEALIEAIKEFQTQDYQLIVSSILGHKADIGFMALGPDWWVLRSFQSRLQHLGLEISYSYVSLTEVSEYASKISDSMKRHRLYPQLPPENKKVFCFYGMSKRRNIGQNWYELPYEKREELMLQHGTSGRAFSGRILQLVTGSTGLDAYEWGVTLFGENPNDIKDVVYTLRYDEASTQYGEFGPFYVGMIGEIEQVLANLGFS